MVWVINSTRMPGSMRMPLEFFTCFVVIINRAIVRLVVLGADKPRRSAVKLRFTKKCEAQSHLLHGQDRYRQTPQFTMEEGRNNARTVMYILWTHLMPLDIQNRECLFPKPSVNCWILFGDFVQSRRLSEKHFSANGCIQTHLLALQI